MTDTLELPNVWTVYFHDFMDSSWNRESYEKLVEYNSVVEFWTVMKILKEWLSLGMFFFMRDDIFPKWDDNENKEMSYLSMKILKANTGDFMEDILVLLLSNTLVKEGIDIRINGISVSPKKNFCICKIWIDSIDDTYKNIELYNIPAKFHGDVLFNNFGE